MAMNRPGVGGRPNLPAPSPRPGTAAAQPATGASGSRGETRRGSFRASVMTTVTVHMKSNPDFVATLVDISESGCRLRAALTLEIGTELSFDWNRRNKPPLRLNGRVVTRRRTEGTMLYDYGLAFQNLKEDAKDAIIAEMLELQRRDAMRNVPMESSIAKQVAAQLGTRRSAYRTPVEFEVFYTLPNQYLKVYEGEHAETEISPFGERTVVKKAVVKPFEPMRVQGRVVNVFKEAPKVQHGIAFVDPHPFVVSEIGRFIHAVQLTRLRSERASR